MPPNPLRVGPGVPPMPRVVPFWRVTVPAPSEPGTVAVTRPAVTFVPPVNVLDGEERVANWKEKPTIAGYINIGCYVMERSFLKYIPRAKMYGMKEAFERAIKVGAPVYGLKMKGEFLDIGDRRAYKEANELYMKRMGKML